MVKAMIVSVGGSPAGQAAALSHHRPELVCFYASNETVENIPEVKRAIDYALTADKKLIVEDPADFFACYQKALECAAFLEGSGLSADQILVDFTGGTKVMSAALSLLAVSKGYQMCYVSGTVRDKGGMGQVISGTEQVFEQVNPWDALAIEERKSAALYASAFQFEAAREAYGWAAEKARQPGLRRYLRAMVQTVEGYSAWDRFQHQSAVESMKSGVQELQAYIEYAPDEGARRFVRHVGENMSFLNGLRQSSRGFSVLCRPYLADLLANARRRASEGKFDDAVARLYRCIEMAEQIALKAYGITTGGVKPDQIPESLRRDYVQRYSSEGRIRLPLHAAYLLLRELGDQLGEKYLARQDELKKVLSSRNDSILAHGRVPVQKKTFESLSELALGFTGLDESDLPVFPHWPE